MKYSMKPQERNNMVAAKKKVAKKPAKKKGMAGMKKMKKGY